jgi:hypothetical protein
MAPAPAPQPFYLNGVLYQPVAPAPAPGPSAELGGEPRAGELAAGEAPPVELKGSAPG